MSDAEDMIHSGNGYSAKGGKNIRAALLQYGLNKKVKTYGKRKLKPKKK